MSRKELIINTAISVIVKEGLYDASINKIAKEAQIPVGSIYTYFDSKEALINEIFISIKSEMNSYIFIDVEIKADIREELKTYWLRAIQFGLKNKQKFFFAEQFVNSPLISSQNQISVRDQFKKIFSLLDDGRQSMLLKEIEPEILHSIIYTHIVGMIKFFSSNPKNFNKKIIDVLYDTCWDGIKK